MKENYIFNISNKLIKIIIENDKLILLDILNNEKFIKTTDPSSKLAKDIKIQLENYFSGDLKKFNIPIYIKGTDFEIKVYKALLDIEYGTTITYKELAEKIGHPKSYRAVGTCAGKNKIPIIIPCHRLIGQNNKLRGLDMV